MKLFQVVNRIFHGRERSDWDVLFLTTDLDEAIQKAKELYVIRLNDMRRNKTKRFDVLRNLLLESNTPILNAKQCENTINFLFVQEINTDEDLKPHASIEKRKIAWELLKNDTKLFFKHDVQQLLSQEPDVKMSSDDIAKLFEVFLEDYTLFFQAFTRENGYADKPMKELIKLIQ